MSSSTSSTSSSIAPIFSDMGTSSNVSSSASETTRKRSHTESEVTMLTRAQIQARTEKNNNESREFLEKINNAKIHQICGVCGEAFKNSSDSIEIVRPGFILVAHKTCKLLAEAIASNLVKKVLKR